MSAQTIAALIDERREFWQDMRANGLILVDAPDRKLAIFANQLGLVVLASQEDHNTHICTIGPDEVGGVVAALMLAQVEAKTIFDAVEPEYEAHLAITKAMGIA